MKLISIIILAVVCFFSGFVSAAEPQDPTGKIETFLRGVIAGGVNESFDKIVAGSPLEKNVEAITSLKKQAVSEIVICGMPLDYEFVKSGVFGLSITEMFYVLKCQLRPLVWKFTFYKPLDTWVLIDISLGQRVGDENLLRNPTAY